MEAVPDLVAPVVIAAFEGWNDAAESATGVVDHLLEQWDARVVGTTDPEDFYDFQVNRPIVGFDDADGRTITWPATHIAVASPPSLTRDIVFIRGIEPNIRWRQFTTELVDACQSLGAELVILLGALLADTPHTRPVPVTGSASSDQLAERFRVRPSTYEGPTGIVGVLQEACTLRAVPAVSCWAAVPHYVAQPPCPKAVLTLLSYLEELLDADLPRGDLVEESAAWEHGVNEMAAQDREVADYVRALEESRDADLTETSGEVLARELERFLRDRGDRPPH